jgi:hypothetical protein
MDALLIGGHAPAHYHAYVTVDVVPYEGQPRFSMIPCVRACDCTLPEGAMLQQKRFVFIEDAQAQLRESMEFFATLLSEATGGEGAYVLDTPADG